MRVEIVVIVGAVIIALVATAFNVDRELKHRSVPQCQEDVVLVGVGDFNKGRWTSYECGPAVDDFALR